MVDNRLWIDSAVSPAHNVSKLPVIHCGVDAVDVLVLYVLDAWAKSPAQHGECGEVQFRKQVNVVNRLGPASSRSRSAVHLRT